ncbi:MAG: Re/Si-specific NAD(P)(+) transhydrogenase subunit alpha [Pseudomonadota bacterium]|nr:Re/Si-specific NAD(P)(+) transhydrogenase subunit alpha [Pseudomonadota bacterium]
MKVGILKENEKVEARVAATPDSVSRLLKLGLEVTVEKDAGVLSGFPDDVFEAAGATVASCKDVCSADFIFSINLPSAKVLKGLKAGAMLVTLPGLCEDDGTLKALADNKVDVLALERIPRISRAQSMDVLSSQANIGGYRAALEATVQYKRFFPLMMTSAGSAKPARVIILGVGVAGLQAIATARRLGAQVWAYDVRPETREQVESLGAKFIELDLGEEGSGEGGYAKELSNEAKKKQQQMLSEELQKADILISTAAIPCRPAPRLILEETVKGMRVGSVIIDMAAATGGNCELTEAGVVVVKYGVTIVGHTNYPGMVSADASSFFARNLVNLMELLVTKEDGKLVRPDYMEDEVTEAALVVHQGEVRF